MYDEDSAGVTTIDLRERRARLRTRQPTLIARHDGRRTAPPTPRSAAATRTRPAAAPAGPKPPTRPAPATDLRPEGDTTAVHWRAPGRHRAPEASAEPRRRPRWRRWPYSVGFDALIALVLLAALVMAVDVLL